MGKPRLFSMPWYPPDDRPFDVAGLGCAAMDVVCLLERYPERNEKVYALTMGRHGGGPVGTALTAVARLGFRASFIGQVGDDFAGRYIFSEFKREGVDVHTDAVQEGVRSQVSICLVDQSSGDRTVVSRYGELVVTERDGPRIAAVCNSCILHVDGYDMEAAVSAARAARDVGTAVVYDCGSVHDATVELLKYTDIAVTSEKFIRQMFGDIPLEEACRRLRDYGPSYTGVTLGGRGAVGLDGERFFEVPAFDVLVVDTTGAGDAFHGGLDVGILLGLDFERAVILASAVAALKCTELGGRTGLPTLEEVRRFIAERGHSFLEDMKRGKNNNT
jgi:sulfofructose kinase